MIMSVYYWKIWETVPKLIFIEMFIVISGLHLRSVIL